MKKLLLTLGAIAAIVVVGAASFFAGSQIDNNTENGQVSLDPGSVWEQCRTMSGQYCKDQWRFQQTGHPNQVTIQAGDPIRLDFWSLMDNYGSDYFMIYTIVLSDDWVKSGIVAGTPFYSANNDWNTIWGLKSATFTLYRKE